MSEYDYNPGERQRGDASMFRKPLWWKMLLVAAIVVALVVALILSFRGAHAEGLHEVQPQLGDCHPYPEIAATLKDHYDELGTGPTTVDATKSAVEVFIGMPAGSLTVVEIFPDNTACYRAFNDAAARLDAAWGTRPKPKGPEL